MKISDHIEYTLLKPNATLDEIKLLCEQAAEYGFPVVIVPPHYVAEARSFLIKSAIRIGTVIGFPLGYNLTAIKIKEAELAIADGADDLDMVANNAALHSGNWQEVEKDIAAVLKVARENEKVLKVIFETGLLSLEQVKALCDICNYLKVDYAKTSTGFVGNGAELETVLKMRQWLLPEIKIKASGGIKTKEFALDLIAVGAERIGTSSGIQFVET